MYVPAGAFAGTFNVAPTLTVAAPAVNVPVVEGEEPKVSTVRLSVPETRVMLLGKEIEKELVPSPVTENWAAAGVPLTRLTPPEGVATSSVPKTTVPAVALAAKVPKSMSTVLLIAIGVTRVAVAVAVAEDCAKDDAENPIIRMAKAKILFFIFNWV